MKNNVFRQSDNNFKFYERGNPNFPPHIHEAIEIIYIEKGNGFAYCDDTLYELEAGDFFIVFPNQIHYYDGFSEDSNCKLIIINPDFFSVQNNYFNKKKPLSAKYKSGEQDKNLMAIFNIIFDEVSKNSSKNIIVSVVAAFLGILLEKSGVADINVNQSCALKIIDYCRKHYKEELTVERLSAELHISRSHISHTFNDKLKISFPDYINSLRLNCAVRLLDKREASITEIAQLSGFQTIRNFNRIFLKKFSISPSEYLKGK